MPEMANVPNHYHINIDIAHHCDINTDTIWWETTNIVKYFIKKYTFYKTSLFLGKMVIKWVFSLDFDEFLISIIPIDINTCIDINTDNLQKKSQYSPLPTGKVQKTSK